MEFFSQEMNIHNMGNGGIFGGKADIGKEFNCNHLSHVKKELNPAKQPPVDNSEVQPMRRVDKNDKSTNTEMALTQLHSFTVSPDTYKTLLDNLCTARLLFLRARNITMNQLDVYKREAIEHMREINRIVHGELENPEASAESLTKELVKVSSEVIKNQQALNRIEMEELVKNLDGLLNTLRSDVEEVKSLAEPENEEESEERSCMDLIFDYSHWCLFVLYVSIVLMMGLSHYLPVLEEYL